MFHCLDALFAGYNVVSSAITVSLFLLENCPKTGVLLLITKSGAVLFLYSFSFSSGEMNQRVQG